MKLTVGKLKKAKPENLLRLARSLNLKTEGMSHGQVARLVRWRITRPVHRFDYENLWENFLQ